MLTSKHFEAIGRLVYQSSLMESRLCLWLLTLRGSDIEAEAWPDLLQTFRFTATIDELKTLVPKAYPSIKDQVLAYLQEASRLNVQRNDVVHGFWQLPSDTLFGRAAGEIAATDTVAKAYRVPAGKNKSPYEITYTAETIASIAEQMHRLTTVLAGLPFQDEAAISKNAKK
jgi:hypothetical protein